MINIFLILFLVIISSFYLCFERFLNCLIALENFNVLLLVFCLIIDSINNHMIFIALMVVSTVEVVVALIVLIRTWSCSTLLDLGGF